MKRTKKTEPAGALVVDKKMRRFWALVDPKDGTMWAECVSAEYSIERDGHWEVQLFADPHNAARAAMHAVLNHDSIEKLEPVEVIIMRASAEKEA